MNTQLVQWISVAAFVLLVVGGGGWIVYRRGTLQAAFWFVAVPIVILITLAWAMPAASLLGKGADFLIDWFK